MACKLGDVTQCVLGEVVGQLKQVAKVREEVEALKQAHAHTAQGLTCLATVSPPHPPAILEKAGTYDLCSSGLVIISVSTQHHAW